MFLAVIAIILTLVLVVGLHELGHALAARCFNVSIKRVSIGFGKPLLQWTSQSGCEWVWAMWPFGGYVQLLNTRISPVPPSEYAHCFDKQAIWKRVIILSAGAVANFLAAWIAFILVFTMGLNNHQPQILSVQPNSLASQSGIVAGDQFLSIGDVATPSWYQVGMEFIVNWGRKEVKISLKSAHSSEIKEINFDLSNIKFAVRERSLLSSLGLAPNVSAPEATQKAQGLSEVMHYAYYSVTHLIYFFLMVLKQLLSGTIPFSILLGPIGLFAASITSFTQGLTVFLYFIASLSVAVGFINLVPLPGLDGGSLVYTLIEKIRGKPVSIAWEILLHRLVFILFFLLLVQLMLNDLQRFYVTSQ